MRKVKCLVIFLTGLLALNACTKVQQLPATPSVKFTSFTVFDTTDILGNLGKGGRLKFYFEDGDGNLGLPEPTGENEDTTNLFLVLYRKVNGEMVQVPDNDPLKPSPYRIPYMVRMGTNQILKGTISVTFVYLFWSPADTIKYDFYIKDRLDNLSNTESTSEIILSVNDVYKNPE
jgi:hypothetical protein